MSSVKERFLRYVKVDTQSADNVPQVPSTDKQFTLAKMLMEELTGLGARDVILTGHCYVMATIPATPGVTAPVVGLIAHMDTALEVSGANVNPVITENYDGGDIQMGNGYVLSPKEHPSLLKYIGQEIICTDGTTLLGADDKAGVAEIMTVAERLLAPDAPAHGEVRICFTPDEEVGCGTKFFNVERFGADFAYTLDGGEIGEINFENFNAAGAVLTFAGTSIHPGSAKGKMVNALHLAMEFDALLPRYETPACTEGYEGFFHLDSLTGEVDRAESHYLIRDHDMASFEKRKATVLWAAGVLNEKYGPGTVSAQVTDRYYNMKEKIDPALIEAAKAAMEKVGIAPFVAPIRGGTDGANLSFMGLPCPNLCAGGHNFHSRYEFVPTQSMERIADFTEQLVCGFAKD